MLVLSRKSMERIRIGDDVVVTVLVIQRNKVQIGIAAPKEIHVLRAELDDVIPELPPVLDSDTRSLGTASAGDTLPGESHS